MGNDIVDLSTAGTRGKSRDTRFLKRVFTAAEQQSIRAAENPDLVLWTFWAAKESAYKILSKLRSSPPIFAYRSFTCEWTPRHGQHTAVIRQLHVTCPAVHARNGHACAPLRVDIHVATDTHCVHTYGTPNRCPESSAYWTMVGKKRLDQSAKASCVAAQMLRGFSDAERCSIQSRASTEVRIAAKAALARRLNMEAGRLQIIRPTRNKKPQPPYLLVDGAPGGIDISLSHHGEWVAWCCSGAGLP